MATDKNSNVFYSCAVPYAALHFQIFKRLIAVGELPAMFMLASQPE
jgi:hypothetical protein